MIKGYWRHGVCFVDIVLWFWFSMGRKYRISSRERPRLEMGEGINYTYGETPLRALESIFDIVEPLPGERFLELGCGTGRLSLAASLVYRLHAVGIEAIPTFVRRASLLARWMGIDHAASFRHGDLFQSDWSDADIIYLTATTFTVGRLKSIDEKIDEMKEGAWLCCLTHRPSHSDLLLRHTLVVDCSWGPATVFICRKLTCALPQ